MDNQNITEKKVRFAPLPQFEENKQNKKTEIDPKEQSPPPHVEKKEEIIQKEKTQTEEIPVQKEGHRNENSTIGAKAKKFFSGALMGLIKTACFIGAKPLELQDGKNSLNESIKVIDDKMTKNLKNDGEIRSSRAGKILGSVLGAAIGTGALVFTGLIALGKASTQGMAKLTQLLTNASQKKNIRTVIQEHIKTHGELAWNRENIFTNKDLVSAFKVYVKGDNGLKNTLEDLENGHIALSNPPKGMPKKELKAANKKLKDYNIKLKKFMNGFEQKYSSQPT